MADFPSFCIVSAIFQNGPERNYMFDEAVCDVGHMAGPQTNEFVLLKGHSCHNRQACDNYDSKNNKDAFSKITENMREPKHHIKQQTVENKGCRFCVGQSETQG